MAISIVRWDDHELLPWKNGLGMTREVANDYRRDGTMLWRTSLATIDRDGPFSDFSGCKRTFMMLEGGGLTLNFGLHGEAVINDPFVPVVFDGGWPTTATLRDGPARAFNVVTAQDDVASDVEVMAVADKLNIKGRGCTLIHVLAGQVVFVDQTLATGETLRLDGDKESCCLSVESGDAMIYRIDIDLTGCSKTEIHA